MSDDDVKPGVVKRASRKTGGYLLNRIASPFSRGVAVNTAKSSVSAAMEAIRPVRFEKDDVVAGHLGRYEDQGVARFEEEMRANGLNADDLDQIWSNHKRISKVFLAAGILFIPLSFVTLFLSISMLQTFTAVALFIIGMTFLALHMRHDFSAWQIQERKFPGFKAYIDARF